MTYRTSDADFRDCKSLQEEEWQVLESIYPDCVSSNLSSGCFKLEISIELGDGKAVTIVNDDVNESPIAVNTSLLPLSSLPPLLLHILLPPNYPLHGPPEIVSLLVTHSWLTRASQQALQEKLIGMWQAGDGVLYDWVEYIRNGDFLSHMSNNVVCISHPAPDFLSPLLIAYDAFAKTARFSENSYACSVCLTSSKGARCLQLTCSHIFCRSCLEDFWKLLIAEGDVGRVGCPDPLCVSASREANEEEVMRVVTAEELLRWKWLREKRALEKDPSLIHCPMLFCQTPVAQPPTADSDDSGWSRLRTCGNCNFSFCSFCRRTWHGPITSCPVSHSEKLVHEYLASPEGSPERELIERRFGKNNILKLVATFEEEQLNRKWLQASTMACPGCHVNVEKSLGCNHMACAKCSQHFCYRCGDKLDARNPYIHFSTRGHKCFSKLFDFQSDDEWQPIEGFDH